MSMAFVSVRVNPSSLRVSRAWLAGAALIVLTVLVATAGYLGYGRLEEQRAENDVLVHDLAATRVERDDLQRSSAELAGNLADANDHVSSLSSALDIVQTDLDSASADVRRLEDEATTLRDRLQIARVETRDASSAAEAQRIAREREARLSSAALSYADAGAALSKTRDRMIDVLREQIAAERAGRTSASNLLVSEYNVLVGTHNRQVDAANTALARLKSLL
jgi:chromosome segregation ATPase